MHYTCTCSYINWQQHWIALVMITEHEAGISLGNLAIPIPQWLLFERLYVI